MRERLCFAIALSFIFLLASPFQKRLLSVVGYSKLSSSSLTCITGSDLAREVSQKLFAASIVRFMNNTDVRNFLSQIIPVSVYQTNKTQNIVKYIFQKRIDNFLIEKLIIFEVYS